MRQVRISTTVWLDQMHDMEETEWQRQVQETRRPDTDNIPAISGLCQELDTPERGCVPCPYKRPFVLSFPHYSPD